MLFRSLALLARAEVAAFRTPEACADAFRAYFAWGTPRHREDSQELNLNIKSGKFDEESSLELFASLGIPVAESQAARAPGFEHSVPYPVAAKILSAQIAHKTEAGGVILGIENREEFDAQIKRLSKLGNSILVQKMESGLAEAIIGYRDDPLVGPLALVGAGGVMAEIYQDVVLGLAPVSVDEAAEMIARVKGFAVLRGYRGLPRGDLRALAEALAALSRLALIPGRPVAEAEINPVIVKDAGAVAVDGLVVPKS